MASFVAADERNPLIQVDRSEHRVWLNDLAECETVGGAHRIAERIPGAFERRPRGIRVELSRRKVRLGSGDAPRAVEDAIHVDRADDGRVITFLADGARGPRLGKLRVEDA